jgi:hypothetical protein
MPVPLYYRKIRCEKGVRAVAAGGTCQACKINDVPIVCPLGLPAGTALPQPKGNPGLAAARTLPPLDRNNPLCNPWWTKDNLE